ncbi:MAG: aspartyl protease family protein [Cyclobacteriaceae bacterium]|nr:aspartyl protease family protein [Cyclobacteriaceae bacterium]UYN86915.1 MAG: aspartyl protease family protein [Cyclobacteriaceae bacterium]
MIRVIGLLIFLVPAILGAQNQNLGFHIADGKSKVQIPIEIHNNLIVVRVILNDVIPLKFIVDTGVRTAILTQKAFADILQLQYSRKYTLSGPGGEKLVDAYVANNVSLTLPGVIGKGHALLVLDDDYLELRNHLGTDVHGVLGYELFSRFIIKIDYQRKIMTLMGPDKFKPGKRYEMIPIRIQDTKPYLLAPISINNEHSLNAKLLVDTGASHGLLLEPETDPRIHLPEKTVHNIIGRGIGGEIVGKTGRIQSLELGQFSIHGVLANFPDSNSYFTDTLKYFRVDRNGTLGGEILSRFTVVFNFPQEKIFLKKNSEFKKAFYFNLSGLNVKAKGSSLNVFEITDVRANSAADRAGVQRGDLIASINGVLVKELHLNQINGFLNTKPGRKVRLEVRRGNTMKSIEFRLEDQI